MRALLAVLAGVAVSSLVGCGAASSSCPAECANSCDPFAGTCVGGDGGVGGGGGGVGVGGGAGGGGGTDANYCKGCTGSGQCGSALNFCLGSGTCGIDCGSGQACPSGSTCVEIVNASSTVVGSNCVPTSGSCGGSGAGGGAGGGVGGGGGGSGATCTDTWSSYAGSFFANSCSGCHGTEFATDASVVANKLNIRSRIYSGNMPQGGGLSAAERARIVSWLDCGAKP